ncbi:uncharacterized protein LOC123318733 isoform X2 [Coccinella septempunctata]|uniref:uncharacterized protein LOC123318733 isoform X2 n=1 Tax=Coccinella septempunctata TaxID=41139 RepID=UPI001D05EFB0|nr:uncharacterized protein LOC123318733 isoform X2 [Coccinella septempunctata]
MSEAGNLKSNKCCVPNCDDRTSKRHRFPRADKQLDIFELWVEKVGNPLLRTKTAEQIRKSYFVCDRHFTDEVKVNSRKGIWESAVPALFLPAGNLKSNKCCVPNCDDRTSKRHRFPRADKQPDIFELWVEKVGNPLLRTKTAEQIRKSYFVCDRHFTDEVKVNSKKGIWESAVPALFLPESSEQSQEAESCKKPRR